MKSLQDTQYYVSTTTGAILSEPVTIYAQLEEWCDSSDKEGKRQF